MPKHTYIEEKLKEFDEKFGTDGPDRNSDSIGHRAGCDDCSENIEWRKEHRDFLKLSLEEAWEKGYEESNVEFSNEAEGRTDI